MIKKTLFKAVALHEKGQLAEAASLYVKILAHHPRTPDALNLLGVLENQRNNPQRAIELIDRALEVRPDVADFRCNRGDALRALNRFDEALASYDEALVMDPKHARALGGRGDALRGLQRFDEALASYDRAIALKPDFAHAFNNRANALKALRRYEEALGSYDRALSLKPDLFEALTNRGKVLSDMHRDDEALTSYGRALALNPGDSDTRYARGYVRLRNGDFLLGWRDYGARPSMRKAAPHLQREPLPKDLRGEHLLVLQDQGLGDEIFFLRFAPELKARGSTVFYRGDERIAPMIARSGAVDHLVAAEETPAGLSRTMSVGDLPFLLGMSGVGAIPRSLRLPPLPASLDAMAARLRALGPAPYTAVTWRAGDKRFLYKEAPRLEIAKALARVPGTLIALQRRPHDGEIEDFAREAGRPVHDLTALNESLEDMLAALALIDRYVCVSNTNVHLRESAGRSCHVLIPYPSEFRWMAKGSESPWFPGTRIYRQTLDGDWHAALQTLEKDLG